MKKGKRTNQKAQGKRTVESSDAPERKSASSDVFADPRQQKERRIRRQLELVPDIGCRRRQRRRNRAYTNDEDWWTKRSYSDDE